MTKNEIINLFAKEKVIENTVYALRGKDDINEDLQDLCQNLYISLYEKDEEFIQHLYHSGEYKYYITKMCLLQVRSAKSSYWYQTKNRRRKFSNIENYYDII